jgi:hypothetical protein
MPVQQFIAANWRRERRDIGATVFLQLSVIFAGIFTATLTSLLVVARRLDDPFAGALALQAREFATLVGKVSRRIPLIGCGNQTPSAGVTAARRSLKSFVVPNRVHAIYAEARRVR